MAHEDILLGVTISDGTTTRTYSAYRIDYDDSRDLAEIAGVDTGIDADGIQTHYSGQVKAVSQTAIDRGYHTPKSGYQQIVLVEDATTRDEVQSDLDAENITYTTEDVAPTTEEKLLIEREDAQTIDEIHEALQVKGGMLDRKLVTSDSKQSIASNIRNLPAGDEKDALAELYHIMTGETPSETLQV